MSGVFAVGGSALLVEVASTGTALALADWARGELADAVLDVVPGASTVLLDGLADPEGVRRLLDGWRAPAVAEGTAASEAVLVPVTYDGPDLADVAARWGVGVDDVPGIHSGADYVSAFCGFSPGFAYLAGLPDELAVPRLDRPRDRVPPGSVALAGSWCGVYPTASPGGWRLLGRSDVTLWDAQADPPALLAPGARVRFVPR